MQHCIHLSNLLAYEQKGYIVWIYNILINDIGCRKFTTLHHVAALVVPKCGHHHLSYSCSIAKKIAYPFVFTGVYTMYIYLVWSAQAKIE